MLLVWHLIIGLGSQRIKIFGKNHRSYELRAGKKNVGGDDWDKFS
jgi:hypothetical protein